MAEFSFEFDAGKAREFFAKVERNVKDVREKDRAYVSSISAVVFQDVMDHFRMQEGSLGKWKAWSKAYRERMERIGKGGNRLLQDNGRLRQTFTPTRWRTKVEGVEWYNPAKTAKGFPYAAAHDVGGPKLPKRDFMWLSQKAFSRVADLTVAYMVNAKGLN